MEPRTLRDELRTVVGGLRDLLVAERDLGLEPPALSSSTLRYIDGGSGSPDSLEGLRAQIGDCRRCGLHRGRTTLVFGEGPAGADLVFVGEGPGKEEDLAGRPFVGEAGRLLTRIIEAMGLTRGQVYICNVVKCRPPRNRDPEADEMEVCLPFLKRQISLIRPRAICSLGRIAAKGLLGRDFKVTEERGRWLSFMDIPLMPTYHPAYLLRNPSAKRGVWDDMKEIMALLGLEMKKK